MRTLGVRHRTLAQVGVLALSLLGGGCGGSNAGSPQSPLAVSPAPTMLASTTVVTTSAPIGSVKILMKNIRFIPDSLKLKSGKIVIFLTNQELGGFHNLGFRDSAGQLIVVSDILPPGTSAVFTIGDLAPGTYKMVCTFETHEFAGMIGTVKVT